MCSCSGSCNCNSTTIPKGPAGPQGPQGIQGNPGLKGDLGTPGDDGINSFTTLTNLFYQPINVNGLANSFVTIDVVDSTWAAINQIIYISYNTVSIGGYYRVISKPSSTTLYITRLDWTIPGVVFVPPNGTVLNNSEVTPAGTKGTDGTNGINGINAYTIVQNAFTQPIVNNTTPLPITVAVNTWIGIGQIIYISSAGFGVGGFYQVNSKSGTNNISVTRLDWVLPNISFIGSGSQVIAGCSVSASGTKGVDGSTGLSFIQDAIWGSFKGTGGINSFKKSIAIPGNTLTVDGDLLECQTVFKIDGTIFTGGYFFYIKLGTSQSASDLTALQFSIPFVTAGNSNYSYMVKMNYTVQKIGAAVFRSKGECFVSGIQLNPVATPFMYSTGIEQSFLCYSSTDLTFIGSSWANQQFVSVIANDVDENIAVINHEVKVVKKKV